MEPCLSASFSYNLKTGEDCEPAILLFHFCFFFFTEVGHPLWRDSLVSSDTHKAPIARPESGFEDSELDESAPSSRVSSTWKGYNLSSVQQSVDNITIEMHPRPRANTDSASPESKRSSKSNPFNDDKATSAASIRDKSSFSQIKNTPPPKPPRTFETERSEGRASFRYKPPPKPPRTFEYDSQTQANFSSSLYWNFPRPRDRVYQTQVSLPGNLGGSLVSNDSVDGGGSEEILPPYSPHHTKRKQIERKALQNAGETFITDDNEKSSLISKTPTDRNFEVRQRGKPSSVLSSIPQSRLSASDSGLNVSPEEVVLLGSVKPRTGRRKRNPLKQAASENLHWACSGANNAVHSDPAAVGSVPHLDANFMETML